MAENFRNKQWFKKLSQERKDELCKKFDIDEKTLRKCGRETEDGRLVIDLLRIDHLLHLPTKWGECYEALKGHEDILNKLKNCPTIVDKVNVFKELYNLFKEHTYSNYKDNLHNNCLVDQMYKYVCIDANEFVSCEEDDKSYYAYRLYSHLNVLISTDLNLIKK